MFIAIFIYIAIFKQTWVLNFWSINPWKQHCDIARSMSHVGCISHAPPPHTHLIDWLSHKMLIHKRVQFQAILYGHHLVNSSRWRQVLSRVRTSYSRTVHTFLISPRTCPTLGLVLNLCEIDPRSPSKICTFELCCSITLSDLGPISWLCLP